jgi:hypothetical protein
MFENLENKPENTPTPESKAPSAPIENKTDAEIPSPKISLEERIEKLVTKGKKRGKRYSIIGISLSLVIAGIVLYVGYYLFSEVGKITGNMNKQSEAIIQTENVDTNGRCSDNCCLASLEKMKKHGFSEVDASGNCPGGYKSSKLDCETSVVWCEASASSTEMQVSTSSDAQEIASSTPDVATSSESVNQSQAKDSDSDGLSDDEEAKYGTDANNPDTDGDGFQDGYEVENGYNPNGPGKLIN